MDSSKIIRIFLPAFLLGLVFIPRLKSEKSALLERLEQAQTAQDRLPEILSKARAYCRRLEKAALDFVCTEDISEKVDHSKDVFPDGAGDVSVPVMGQWTTFSQPRRFVEKNKYLYDYQFIRKNEIKVERRILLEENGKKKHEEDASLKTQMIRIQNVMFGPLGLLGADKQPEHDYKIIGEETLNGQKAVVLEAIPKSSSPAGHSYGKIWVKEDGFGVLKIEWFQKSIGNYKLAEAIAKKYNAEPLLTSISEYSLEKNGIRFPNRDITEEAYILENKTKFVRSETVILYKDYKFFIVETEIKF